MCKIGKRSERMFALNVFEAKAIGLLYDAYLRIYDLACHLAAKDTGCGIDEISKWYDAKEVLSHLDGVNSDGIYEWIKETAEDGASVIRIEGGRYIVTMDVALTDAERAEMVRALSEDYTHEDAYLNSTWGGCNEDARTSSVEGKDSNGVDGHVSGSGDSGHDVDFLNPDRIREMFDNHVKFVIQINEDDVYTALSSLKEREDEVNGKANGEVSDEDNNKASDGEPKMDIGAGGIKGDAKVSKFKEVSEDAKVSEYRDVESDKGGQTGETAEGDKDVEESKGITGDKQVHAEANGDDVVKESGTTERNYTEGMGFKDSKRVNGKKRSECRAGTIGFGSAKRIFSDLNAVELIIYPDGCIDYSMILFGNPILMQPLMLENLIAYLWGENKVGNGMSLIKMCKLMPDESKREVYKFLRKSVSIKFLEVFRRGDISRYPLSEEVVEALRLAKVDYPKEFYRAVKRAAAELMALLLRSSLDELSSSLDMHVRDGIVEEGYALWCKVSMIDLIMEILGVVVE